jgi:phage terminase small subunit
LKLLRGNPGRRRITQDERDAPAADTLPDTPPPELKGNLRARNEWRRIAPLVSQADSTSAIALCFEWAAYLDAKAQLRRADERRMSKTGVQKISPYVVIADRALNNCLRLWNELGLTPGGRAKGKLLPTTRNPSAPVSKWGNLI